MIFFTAKNAVLTAQKSKIFEVLCRTAKYQNLVHVSLERRRSDPRNLSVVIMSAAKAGWYKFILIRIIESGTMPLNLLNIWISLKLFKTFQMPVIYHNSPS